MNGRITLRLPERCALCGAAGGVGLEQTIKGTSVVLNWSCRSCGGAWPVAASDEQPDRRTGAGDRRAGTRGRGRREDDD
jgi:hypothetical protein